MSKPSHVSSAPVESAAGLSQRYIEAMVPEAMQAADTLARYFIRRRLPVEEDEIRNQAFVVCMESLRDYDPARGDVVPYMFSAARTSVGMTIARWLAPVTVSDAAIKKGVKIRSARPSRRGNDEDADVDPLELVPAAGPTPEECIEIARRCAGYSAARRRYEAAIWSHLKRFYRPDVRRALGEAVGIGGRSRTISEAAQHHRVQAAYLGREYQRLRKWLWASVEVNMLRREMDVLDPEAG